MHLTSAVSSSGESSWAILGMAVRASLALGLHRDGENWSLPQEACEERRLVFWEVAAYEKLQSANLGRPSGLKEATIDTKVSRTGARARSDACRQLTIRHGRFALSVPDPDRFAA